MHCAPFLLPLRLPFRAEVITVQFCKIATETRPNLINDSDNILCSKQGSLESGRISIGLEASVPGMPSGCCR